jgi:hypothetical protein
MLSDKLYLVCAIGTSLPSAFGTRDFAQAIAWIRGISNIAGGPSVRGSLAGRESPRESLIIESPSKGLPLGSSAKSLRVPRGRDVPPGEPDLPTGTHRLWPSARAPMSFVCRRELALVHGVETGRSWPRPVCFLSDRRFVYTIGA